MKPCSRNPHGLQAGMSLATALFVITVMAVLATLILQLVRNNADTTREEIELIRAFYTAESGVQIMLNRVYPPNGGAVACPVTLPQTYNMTEDGLNACSAEVDCDALVVSGDTYYTVTSTGTCGPVSRTIQVRAQ